MYVYIGSSIAVCCSVRDIEMTQMTPDDVRWDKQMIHTHMCCSVLQCVAVRCSVLQCVVVFMVQTR